MGKRSKLILACLATAAVLSLAAGSADARNFRISQQNIRAVWSSLRFIAGGTTVTCHVTMEGSFVESTAVKSIGILVARFSRANVTICTGGNATILSTSLPWHRRYRAFIGRLPFILKFQVSVIGLSISIRPEGSLTCLAATTETHPAILNYVLEESGSGSVTEATFASEAEIPLTGEGGLCAFGGAGHLEGSGSVEVAGGTTKITITLI